MKTKGSSGDIATTIGVLIGMAIGNVITSPESALERSFFQALALFTFLLVTVFRGESE